MRQACGGPPALSQINHAADPVPSAWGPNRARMLSLSHGPGPLSSPQHSTQLLWGSRGMGGWNAPERHALLPFFPFSFCGHQEIDAGREKQKHWSHLHSTAAATTAPFYCSSEGPVGSGQALRFAGDGVWWEGVWFCLPGASCTCLETTYRHLCALKNSRCIHSCRTGYQLPFAHIF